MESETPADVRIFFKDKKNELKGPYTERQVQDWYRQNWFDSSFPFYFMNGEERPTEQTEFVTLDTLRTLNGIGCPFASIKPESNSEKIEEKIAKLEKELADLSKKCDGVKELEKRLEEMEKRLKELSTQPPTSSSAAVAVAAKEAVSTTASKKPEKKPEENSEHVRLANAWAAYYLEVLEAYKTNKWDKVNGDKMKLMLATLLPVFKSEPLRLKCREVLLKKLIELDYVYCSECDAIFHNSNQILMHVSAQKHNQESDALHEQQKAINTMMMWIVLPLVISLTEAENNHTKELLDKHRHIDTASPNLRPTFDFVGHVAFAYRVKISAKNVVDLYTDRDQIVAKMIDRFNNDQTGCKMMNELHEHIGDRQTRCYSCDVVTGNREEYYQHLRTFVHLIKSDAMDFITLVVNRYKKE